MTGKHSNLPAQSGRAARIVPDSPPCYIPSAALPDVIREQMDFLLAHAGHNTPGCAECLRLEQAVWILMRPFR